MAEYKRLSKPPLREALVDIQLADLLPVSISETLGKQTIHGFEDIGPIRQGQFALQFGPTVEPKFSVQANELLGFRYTSRDKSRVIQLRRNGMTYSILSGYSDWNQFRYSAQEIWRMYNRLVGEIYTQRLALRYINVIDLPPGGGDFDDYLTSGPKIPRDLPQMVNSFFYRTLIPFLDLGIEAIVHQAIEARPPAQVSIVLDIDVYGQFRLRGDDDEIWSRLDRIRDVKNLIFFSHLTEKALEPYV
jgi:uncharacterized protein (TIGR04255 family)